MTLLISHNYNCNWFLSPARRGRGILVAPGFCPASRFLVGAKTTGQFFWNFNITFLATWGCASDFLEMLPKFKVNSKKICGRKKIKALFSKVFVSIKLFEWAFDITFIDVVDVVDICYEPHTLSISMIPTWYGCFDSRASRSGYFDWLSSLGQYKLRPIYIKYNSIFYAIFSVRTIILFVSDNVGYPTCLFLSPPYYLVCQSAYSLCGYHLCGAACSRPSNLARVIAHALLALKRSESPGPRLTHTTTRKCKVKWAEYSSPQSCHIFFNCKFIGFFF